ncbi:MAG: sopA 1, partial [Solimicrobium sp.]|nr:sopA 1 [Solimicrobium sp.]
ANLDFLDLSGLNMSGTSFTGARLCGVNLCNSTLRNANLIGAILKSPFDVIVFGKKVSTNLRGINLENASLTGVDLNQLDITGASLAGANLTGANLSRANLTKCNLKNTILENADLRGTDLTEAVLNLTRFNNYTKFDEFTVLQRAEITFGFIGGAWHDAPLGQLLDHKINRNNSSLLTVIDSMNVKYVNNEGIPLKINLMHQIIDSFGNVNPLPVHAALLDIFLNNPIYFRDKKIIAFVKKNILNPKISKANTARLNIDNVAELRWYLNMLLKTKVSNQNQNFMLKNNGFFIQLMAFCTGHENVQIKGDAEKVYNKYLNLSPLSIYKTNNLLLPEVTCDAKGYVKDIEDTDRAFIFVSKNGVETNKGLLVSRNDIKEMLNVGTTHDWSATYFVENGVVVFPPDLTRVFSLFSLFNSAKEGKSLIKLTGKEDIHPLNEIFTPLFNLSRGNAQTMTITEVHFRAIIAMYNLETVSLADQAQTLFCLAAIFVKYSSSYIFGTEDESPYVIRTYGAALLNKARELNPILFTNALFKDWMDRLVGITGAQTFASCTAQLSSDLMAFANRQQDFRNTLAKMKPPAW